MKPTVFLTAALLCALSPDSFAKPLKVYILSGQSNMQGHANTSTFDYIGKDPLTAPILAAMRDTQDKPRVCENVWISSLGCGGNQYSDMLEKTGKLTAGFGASDSEIGPEFTFGIYIEKMLKEPVLIIKTSWGGRSLNTDFRPPSAGPYTLPKEIQEVWDKYPQGAHGVPKLEDRKKWQEEKDAASGVFYRAMIEHVRKVLKDIKRVCPEYDEKAGYELAGFVWLQGFNDLVDGQTYPNGNFDEYSRLLSHFIRDVRKDLSAPKMPFVIGVLGVEGDKNVNFRKAMAAPADMPEFKGNVLAVDTAPFWDHAIAAAQPKQHEYNNIVGTAHTLKKDGTFDREWKWENYWKPVGKPLPEDRIWRFATIDAAEKKDKLEKYEDRRFRDITLPAGMENWFMPDFDDSKWTEGKAPIGKGVWKHNGITLDKFPSTWGAGEFLLMRTTFEIEDLNFDSYRIANLARQGFHVYLNGNKIHTYIWWQDKPVYGSIVLEKEQVQYLKKGKNVLAVYANDQYDLKSPEHYAAIDLRIEGITKADKEKLDLALEEVLSPKDREALKGASNGGYHYFGSAKILAQMGKAFAEALISQKMPWEDPNYAKDISATQADSRAEERAKGGWTEFIRHHEDRKRWVTEKKVDILMIGDSIVFGWSREGHEVWNEHYGNRNAVNIGSSGDRTSHMLWHIQDGGLDGMKDRNPEVVVIMIGTNNRGEPANEGRDTAQGVLAILKEVHHRLPDSKILLLAIFPREWKPTDAGRIRNDQVNSILKTYADNKTVYWLDLKETFLGKDGMLRKDLMPDALHPNVEGYREWAKAMEPMLTKLLGK